MVTLIRKAAWAAVWDANTGRHAYQRDIDIAFDERGIQHIGPDYRGRADDVIAGERLFAMPGLIDVHSHLLSENIGRSITEEVGEPGLYMSGLYDPKPLVLPGHSMELSQADAEGMRGATQAAIAELLLSGVTTIVDLALPYEGWLDTLAASGIRAYAAPMYRSARWAPCDGHRLDYVWDEAAGTRAMAKAIDAVRAAMRHPSGRLYGMVSPAQVDTCTPELLRESRAEAERLGVPMTLHTSQSVVEFQEMIRRHGLSPVQWLAEQGLLNPHLILGHGLFLDHHSWLHWHSRRDLPLLAESGAVVAHCPVVFARYGQVMESFGGYVRAGVKMAIGTDTQPHNMLEEMRMAAILSRIGAEHVGDVALGDVFHAATAGGAKALGRDDIGRIALGAKSDLVLVDLSHPAMRPARDPIRSLVFSAADRAVKDVYVDGRKVVGDGRVMTIDRNSASQAIEAIQQHLIDEMPHRDKRGRTVEDVSPLALPLIGTNRPRL